MAGLGVIQFTDQPEDVAGPGAKLRRAAPPAAHSAFEAAVRDKVVPAIAGDLGKVTETDVDGFERDVVEPEHAGAAEPDLQAAGFGWHVRLRLEGQLDRLPRRLHREGAEQTGLGPGSRVAQTDADLAAGHPGAFGPTAETVPLATGHPDDAELADHRVAGGRSPHERGAFQSGAMAASASRLLLGKHLPDVGGAGGCPVTEAAVGSGLEGAVAHEVGASRRRWLSSGHAPGRQGDQREPHADARRAGLALPEPSGETGSHGPSTHFGTG